MLIQNSRFVNTSFPDFTFFSVFHKKRGHFPSFFALPKISPGIAAPQLGKRPKSRSFACFRANRKLHNPSKPADTARALEIVEAVLRFLGKNGILDYVCHGGYVSQLLEGHSMVNVKSNTAGFFLRKTEVSARVKQGELLAQIVGPCLGTVIEGVLSPVDGIVFFHASHPILYSHTSLFRIIPS